MKFTKIQKDIIKYISDYEKGSGKATPCIEVLQDHFKSEYSKLEVRDNVLELVSRGVLHPYSFHAYLGLTERFKTRYDHTINNK